MFHAPVTLLIVSCSLVAYNAMLCALWDIRTSASLPTLVLGLRTRVSTQCSTLSDVEEGGD